MLMEIHIYLGVLINPTHSGPTWDHSSPNVMPFVGVRFNPTTTATDDSANVYSTSETAVSSASP